MPRTRSPQSRTELIVSAARELFGQYGYEKTTVEDIARRTGIGKGSIYLEFPSKQDILMTIIKDFTKEMQEFLSSAVAEAGPPYLDVLEETMKEHVLRVHERATSQIHTPEALIHTSQKFRRDFGDHFNFVRARITDLLDRSVENNEIDSKANLDELADTLLLAMSVLCPPYLRNSTSVQTGTVSRKQLKKEADALLSLVIGGIKQTSRQR